MELFLTVKVEIFTKKEDIQTETRSDFSAVGECSGHNDPQLGGGFDDADKDNITAVAKMLMPLSSRNEPFTVSDVLQI